MNYDEEDPFVPIWEGPYLDAELVKMRIEEAHIPVEYGDALLPGHGRVQVPRSYLAEVNDVIKGVAAPWPEITEHGPSGVQVKPAVQLGTKAIALYLAIALFVGSAIVLVTLLLR